MQSPAARASLSWRPPPPAAHTRTHTHARTLSMLESGRSLLLAPDGEEGAASKALSSSSTEAPGAPPPPRTFWQHVYDEVV